MSDNSTYEIKVNDEEVMFLQMGLGLLITMFGDDIENWQNKKDSSMDKFFFLMNSKYGAMELWRKVLVSAGIEPEIIAEYLASVDQKGDE
jgi:hypothetical protein